ncbi:SEC10/PgrA surface exclusion domain-containing protein, partial [Streptococcus suis]
IDTIENMTVPTLSQDVIDAYKTFVASKTTANKDALFDAIQAWYNTQPFSNLVSPIDTTVVDPANLTKDQVTALSQYYVYIENAVRKQIWGSNNQDVVVTTDSIDAAMQIANNYEAENKNTSGHSYTALRNDGNDNVRYNSEGIGYISTK